MRNTFARFLRLAQVRYPYPNPLDRQQASGLLHITLLMSVGVIVGLISEIVSDNGQSTVYLFSQPLLITRLSFPIIYGVSLVGFLVVIAQVNRGNITAARPLYVGMLTFLAICQYLLTGTLTYSTIILMLPLVAAGVLLRRREFWFVVVIFTLIVFLSVLMLQAGIIRIDSQRGITLFDMSVFVFPTTFVAALMLAGFAGNQLLLLERNLVLAEELRGLTAISNVIDTAINTSEMLIQLVETARDKLGYYHVQVFVVEEQTGIVSLAASTSVNRAEAVIGARRFAIEGPGVINEAIRSRQTRRITQTASAAQRSEFLSSTRAQLLVPIKREKRVLGIIDIQSVQADAFSAQDISALEAIASEVAFALENKRLAEEVSHNEQERLEFKEQNRLLTREVERLTQEISGRAWVKYLESRPDRSIGYDYKEGVITTNPSPTAYPPSASPFIETRGDTQVLCVPIALRGQILGVMEFTAQPDQAWDLKSVELSRAIAQRLALSLDNLRLFEQAQMAVAREQVANQVSTLLQARSDVDSLLSAAADIFQQALGASQISIRFGSPTLEGAPVESRDIAAPRNPKSKNGESVR